MAVLKQCTIYIDESGDAGISSIRSDKQGGSTEYFTMGAAVLQPTSADFARNIVLKLEVDFKKPKGWRHATDLNHSQRLHLCRTLTELHVRYFGIISYKPTLGAYASNIEWDAHKFYNKCAKYLLELIGQYLSKFGDDFSEPQIVFEKRNHDYDKMIRYLGKVKGNPIYDQSKALSKINPFAITKKSKKEEVLLRIADMVSHALYSCVNKTPENFGITEPRYVMELAPRFACNENGVVLGTGIKPIHKLTDLNLDASVLGNLKSMRAVRSP